MNRARHRILIALCACLVAGLALPAAAAAGEEDFWQLLDFKDRETLEQLGITAETTKQAAIGIVQNALARHKDAAVRATCAKVLGRFEAKSAGEVLTRALADPNADVRRWAAQALGVIGEKRALQALAQLLKKDPSWQSRLAIVRALKMIGDRRGGAAVAEALVKDPDWRVRKEAADAISAMAGKRAAKHLLQALSDPHATVRAAAAAALGQMGERRALNKLIELLQDEDARARFTAAAALGKLASKKAVKPLIACLDDEDARVRSHCAIALGSIGSSKAIKPLQQLVENDPDEHVRDVAEEAIERIK